MRLISLHIENFGKLHDFDFNFTDEISQIFEKNGFGKTTFSHFLKAMFYGMAKKGNLKEYVAERSHYMPWQGGVYGGSVRFEVNDKLYQITRTFGKTPDGDTFELVDLNSGLKVNDYDENVGLQIFGVGCQTFELSAFIPQERSVAGVNDELRASLTGSDKFDYDLTNLTSALKSLSSSLTLAKSNMPKQIEIDRQKAAKVTMENKLSEDEYSLNQKKNRLDVLKQDLQKAKVEEERKNKILQLKHSIENEISVCNGNIQSRKSRLETLNSHKQTLLAQQNDAPVKKTSIFGYVASGLCLLLCAVLVTIGVLIDKFPYVFYGIAGVCLVICVLAFALTLRKNSAISSQHQTQNNAITQSIMSVDNEIQGLIKEIETFENDIKQKQSNLDSIEIDNEDNNVYNISKQIAVLNTEIEYLSREITRQNALISKAEDDIADLNDRKQQLSQKIELIEKTKAFLEKARDNVSARFVAPLQGSFDKFFAAIEEEKRNLIKMDANLNMSEVAAQGLKEIEFLSTGYKDLISLCKRLALVEHIFTKENPFVVIDDALVNLDDKKLDLAKIVLKNFAKTHQIIYLCANSRCKI